MSEQGAQQYFAAPRTLPGRIILQLLFCLMRKFSIKHTFYLILIEKVAPKGECSLFDHAMEGFRIEH